MKKVLDLLIHLEDHKHDSLGRLFLDPGDEREMRRSLREYLGTKVAVKTAAVDGQRISDDIIARTSRPRNRRT
jgi:hypothetical protein